MSVVISGRKPLATSHRYFETVRQGLAQPDIVGKNPFQAHATKRIGGNMNLRAQVYALCTYSASRKLARLSRDMAAGGAERTLSYRQALLKYARDHVPYYRQHLDGDWTALPTLTKTLIRENLQDLQSDDLSTRQCLTTSSGGSTGQPISLVQDAEYREWNAATQDFFCRHLIGVDYGRVPTVVLWGSERDLFGLHESWKHRIRNWLLDTTFLNSFRMTQQDMARYVEIINRRKPVLLRGYAGSLYEMARFAKARGLRLHHPRKIWSAAETLRPFMRQAIEEMFNCPVHDFYGSREVGPMAGECEKGRLHIFSFNNLVEVVDANNQPVGPGQEGRVLVTTLHNFAMPLIRYDIGDAAVAGEPCDCGLALPTLARVLGRVTDHFKARDGTLVHGEYFTHLFYFRDWVREFQVLQRDFDLIEVYYVRHGTIAESDVAEINGKIRLVMGANCRIEWREVAEIPRTPQGKLLYTRSLVADESSHPGGDR
jgi:phenylacetate-CoA ligase